MAVIDMPSTVVETSMRTIGPEEAQELLAANTHNRKLRQARVEQLAGAMTRGEWLFNGDAIRISATGRLLDGQHRLAAVIRSGLPQEFLVISGLSEFAQETMDTGAKRSVGDVLKLRGEKDVNRLASVVRHVLNYEQRQTFRSPAVQFTTQQLIDALDRHPGTRDAVRATRPVIDNTQLMGSVAGSCYYLFSRVDTADTEVFFTRLALGSELVAGNPIHALRRRFLDPRPGGVLALPAVTQAALTIKAFNAWRRGDDRVLLRWAPGGALSEKFPLVEGLEL